MDKIRVRFAPSPTGFVHVGSLRTALYNYLFAKRNNGTFVLRIEDTDRNRYVEGAVENLINTMHWCGIEFDEGPVEGGNFGPYVQSERNEIYQTNVKRLIETGKAYPCFCTPERLQQLKETQKGQDQAKYDKLCLKLTKEESEEKIKAGIPYVIRLNVEEGQKIIVDDLIRGRVEFDSSVIDDQVLIKSDGYPTYHLANVVDDHYMQISHVIRGEEWLPSTPKHVLLYDYFGWEKPKFAHLPLLLNPDKSKLSKRQGDVAVEDYRKKGYLKEALINFVALLGWNAGDDKEFYYMNELIENFSLERVNKSGAVFNVEKLNWLNFEHLRKKPKEELLQMLKEEKDESRFKDVPVSDRVLLILIDSMLERVNFVHEFIDKCPYFFEAPSDYDAETVKKRWTADSSKYLIAFIDELNVVENPIKEDYEKALHNACEKAGIGHGKLIHPLRLAVSGMGVGPGVFDILNAIGKEETIRRIRTAIEKIKL